MTVDLVPAPTDEQAMLLDAAVRFIEAKFPLATVRQRVDGGEVLDGGYLRAAADLGWLGLLADEADGGGSASGNGLLDAAMIAAERGAGLQPGPFVGHNVVVHALSTAGTHREILADLLEGRCWASWVPDTASLELRASEAGKTLHGTVDLVAEAGDCAWLLVTAAGTDGPAQVLVATDAPGVTVRRLEGLDLTRCWFAVEFDGAGVAAVGEPGHQAAQRAAHQTQIAAVLSAAEAVGAMHANFALAVEYARSRIAFGRPIGSFQAVKHVLADTSLWLEMSKGIVAAAADALGRGRPDGAAMAHIAKSFVGERGIDLTHNCFQVFGGIGYTWEHDQHLFLRRLGAEAVAFGSPEWHRQRLIELEGLAP